MHGRKGVVSISGITIAKVTAFNYEEKADSVDATAMGDSAKSYETGLSDGSGTIDCLFLATDYSATTGQGVALAALKAGTSVTLNLKGASDVSSGQFVGLSGTAVVNSYSYNQSFDDTAKCSFGFQGVLVKYTG